MTIDRTTFRPDFFDQVDTISMHDELALELGAIAVNESLVYAYRDAVKLAGHSCLAISGAYRLTQIALKKLYADDIPQRGHIKIVFRGAVDHKVNGPVSQIITLITGAAGENGFHGFADGRFKRQGLMHFDKDAALPSGAVVSVTFTRVDSEQSVSITYYNHMLPENLDLQQRVRLVLVGDFAGMFCVE